MSEIWDVAGLLINPEEIAVVYPPADNKVRIVLRGGASLSLDADGKTKTADLHARLVKALGKIHTAVTV